MLPGHRVRFDSTSSLRNTSQRLLTGNCYCSNVWSATIFIEALEQTVQEGMAPGWPVGYTAICLAVLQSQRTDDPQEAEHILGAVTLSDEGPPLLDDIRLLARCAVAHRAGDDEREAVLMRQFLERQPMLLEPSRAFDVRLLRYQERLKPLYREGKRHTGVSG